MDTRKEPSREKQLPADAATLSRDILDGLSNLGYRGKIVPSQRIRDLESGIKRQRQSGALHPEVWEKHIGDFDFNVTRDYPDARAIIVVAAPQPHLRLTFEHRGQTVPVVVPPIYTTRIDRKIEALLTEMLAPAGYRVFRRPLPVKLLAVHSGLARYGRNNIAYVEGMGSYLRLVAVYTDLPVADGDWFELKSLDECDKCTTCLKKCPTGAIVADRFVIHAERCLTFYNEWDDDFPAGLNPTVHHCLIGCLYCQAYCPANRSIPIEVADGPAFDSGETTALIRGSSVAPLPRSVIEKFEEFGCLEGLPEITRNLRLLLETPGNIERGLSFISGKDKPGGSNGDR